MELKEKVTEALRQAMEPERIVLWDDDGITGIVVSSQFRRVPALERQNMIDKALRNASPKLKKAELRKVILLAALTPAEFAEHDYD